MIEAVVGDDDRDLVSKVKAFAAVRKDKLTVAHKAKGKFLCVLHNDAWCNNFMFK